MLAAAGRVTNSAGRGVAGVRVILDDRLLGNHWTLSGPDGKFRLLHPDPPPTFDVLLQSGFGSSRVRDVRSGATDLSLQLETLVGFH